VGNSPSGEDLQLERWFIPMIGPKFPSLTLKSVEHSRYLPKCQATGNLAEGSTEFAPMIEFLAQGSIKPKPPWLVPFPERNMPGNEWESGSSSTDVC
jgi:hypothetical protein